MTSYALAIDEEGEPFPVPDEVQGWRVRRSDGRGRPALVHGRGKLKGRPLIVPVDASHGDLLDAAGPGRYRLEPVDAQQRRVEGVPPACTGPLMADDSAEQLEAIEDVPAGRGNLEAALCQSMAASLCQAMATTGRTLERVVDQASAMMTAAAGLLNAAHHAGITSRPPPPPPILQLVPLTQDDGEEETGEQDENDEEHAQDESESAHANDAGWAMPEWLQQIISTAVTHAVPLIVNKIASEGGSIAGMPLAAFFDWRKAVPTPKASPPAPSASAAPVAAPPPPVPDPAPIPPASASATSAASAVRSASTAPVTAPTLHTSVPAASPHAAPSPAGAAPSGESPPGAVPAAGTEPATSSPPTEAEIAAMLDAHIGAIMRGLSPSERTRAGQLIAQLAPEVRSALLGEFARLSVPEAIQQARALLEAQAPTLP